MAINPSREQEPGTEQEPVDDLDADLTFHPSIEHSYALGAGILESILKPPLADLEPLPHRPLMVHWFESPMGMAIATEGGTQIIPIACRDDVLAFDQRLEAMIHPVLQQPVKGNG